MTTPTTPNPLEAFNDTELQALINSLPAPAAVSSQPAPTVCRGLAAVPLSAPTVPAASPAGQKAEKEFSPQMNFDALRRHRAASKPQTMQTLTVDECRRMLGIRRSVKMNFIPMMLTALARQEAAELCDYAAAHRLTETKNHTRLIRQMLDEYDRTLRAAYGRAYDAFVEYQSRFDKGAAGNVWLMHLHADTLSANQYPERTHRAVAVHALISRMIIDYCEDFDRKIDRMLTEKLRRPVSRRPDTFLTALRDLCQSILKDTGHDLEPDETLRTWIGVISNQAWRLVDEIITREDEEYERQHQAI